MFSQLGLEHSQSPSRIMGALTGLFFWPLFAWRFWGRSKISGSAFAGSTDAGSGYGGVFLAC
jgi:hypothetical protein